MNAFELMKGRKVNVKTDMNTTFELTISEVKHNKHSKDLEPSTAANDWWPATKDWSTYTVTFTNGAKKEYNSLEEIDIS